jgi:CheY-like chemotaxis protein/transcriptional regulator with XRE-family HTH domain
LDSPWFLRQVRTALNSLYDPSVLRNSPLVSLLGLEQRSDTVAALRRALTDAIESLQPTANTPRDSKTWRVYQILRRRYIEQLNQKEVASDLGLSTRQLQREEQLARQVLVDHLWAAHHLDAKRHLIPITADQEESPPEDEHIPTRAQELEWLKQSMPVQTVDVGDVLRDVLSVLDPVLKSSRVKIEYLPQADVPRVSLQVPILRQALLDVIGEAVHCAPGGQIHIVAKAHDQTVSVSVQAHGSASSAPSAESLEMTGQLVQLCGGTLELRGAAAGESTFAASITLPATEQATVLVIDDNADALQLAQRYLANSRYRFIGTQDAEHGLALAEDLSPQVIVLDVMMPERDGWTVLGQLREHPKTHDIPVIICSILAQEQLALTLGAAQFLRKPITRQSLLSTLDRQLDLAAKKPC